MSFLNLSKAIVLSFATLAAGFTLAEPNEHRSDSVPARPSHKTAMHQEMMDHGMKCDEGKMASCCDKKHKKMCDEMMKERSESMPCHGGTSDNEAS